MELLLARAGALTATGQFAESHAALLESLELAPQDSFALQTRLTTACASVEHLLGRHEEAHARLASALTRLPDPGSPEAVALMIELAVDGFYRMEYEPMREWAMRALEAARPLGVSPLTAAAAAVLALAVAFTGDIAEAEKQRVEVAALVDALSDAELALRLDAASNLAAAELYLDRYEEAGAHAERAMAVGVATDQASIVPFVAPVLGCVGSSAAASPRPPSSLDGAVEATRLSGNVQGLAWNLLNRSFAALAAGDVETALETGQESVDLTHGLDQSLVSAWAGAVLAGALFEAGEPRRAIETLAQCAGGEELPLIPGGWRVNCLELLTRCWLALDEPELAATTAARAETHAAIFGLPLANAMAHRATAAVSLASNHPADAVEQALASCAAADEVGAPVEAAISRILLGRALAAGRADRTCGRRARPCGRRPDGLRRLATPSGRRTRTPSSRTPHPPAYPPRKERRNRGRNADTERAPDRKPRGRSEDESADRRDALPQPEDGRDAPPQHFPQARRLVTHRGSASRRTCR